MTRPYPRKADIARAVQAARDNGISIAAMELSPNGVIKIIGVNAKPDACPNEFDRWDAAGKL